MLAKVVASSTTSITVLVPEDVNTGPITVTVDGLSTAGTNDFISCTAPEQPKITQRTQAALRQFLIPIVIQVINGFWTESP